MVVFPKPIYLLPAELIPATPLQATHSFILAAAEGLHCGVLMMSKTTGSDQPSPLVDGHKTMACPNCRKFMQVRWEKLDG